MFANSGSTLGRAVDRGIQINRGISIFLPFLSGMPRGVADFSLWLLQRKVAIMLLPNTNLYGHVSVQIDLRTKMM